MAKAKPTQFDKVQAIYNMSLFELVSQAHHVHITHHTPGEIQTSELLSIKTGGCPEDCGYCPQSAHYNTGLEKEALLDLDVVSQKADEALLKGATRFCMGAAWREVKDGPQFDQVIEMVKLVKKKGLEVCCTLGMIKEEQAVRLKEAGLHAYNHNIDTSKDFYSSVISTRNFEDRMETLNNVRQAGLTVCTGGILGLGESHEDRIGFLETLSSLSPQPESVTVNTLVQIPGTPMEDHDDVPALDIVRLVAAARVLMPESMIRLSAGRNKLTSSDQFLLYLAGANSIFLGETLLTSPNFEVQTDRELFEECGLTSKSL